MRSRFSICAAIGALAVVTLAGCLHDTRPTRDRGALGAVDNVPRIVAPLKQRCESYGKSAANKNCEEARYLAQIYVRRLAAGDEVCIEGGFGDPPTGACKSRAAVVDTADNTLLLEVREAKPDSKWFNKESNEFWWEEGALVDLYLADHGY